MRKNRYDVSVRELVEFLLRHGDIAPGGGSESPDRMALGVKIHKKLQSAFKEADNSYVAEKTVQKRIERDGITFFVAGRIDGYRVVNDCLMLDEIKSTDAELDSIEEAELLHMAQGRVYAAILLEEELKDIKKSSVGVIYANIETTDTKVFSHTETRDECIAYFEGLLEEYIKWILFEEKHKDKRTEELKQMKFPFPAYRQGQRELAVSVYRCIMDGGKMFANAPTGIGKTSSTLFPALKAMGEELTDKIFYLTARNAGAIPPADAMNLLKQQSGELSYISLTSKEKICPYKKKCSPDTCPYAKGHFDRINNALWESVNKYRAFSGKTILALAKEYNVCPFELSLDISLYCDVIIGDYNYLFDPKARLARYFGDGTKADYTFLIDEAHNLPDRARSMFTATLSLNKFISTAEAAKPYSKGFWNAASTIITFLKEEKDKLERSEDDNGFSFQNDDSILAPLEKFCSAMSRFTDTKSWRMRVPEEIRERMLELYFDTLFYLKISDLYDEKFCFLRVPGRDGDFKFTLFCADPSGVIAEVTEMGRGTVFFSGTLAPMNHYIDCMGGKNTDAIVDVPSPFPHENRLTIAAFDVATAYSRRAGYYDTVAEYVERLTKLPTGNYMVFFGSYKYLREIEVRLPRELKDEIIFTQPQNASYKEREKFLDDFVKNPVKTRIGLCVLGGAFSEGVDLVGDRLSGVIIVGVGLPMISMENQIIQAVTGKDEPERGFKTAYVYPGINKVLQAAGRVIRTDTDRGFVVYLDERYRSSEYEEILSADYNIVKADNIDNVFSLIEDFL